MATDTFASRGINSVIWANGDKATVVMLKANGTDIKPGYLVTTYGETNPDIDLCDADERAIGVVLERSDVDIDTAYDDDDDTVPVLLFAGSKGVGFWGFLAANNACNYHTLYKPAAGGMLQAFSLTAASSVVTTEGSPTNAELDSQDDHLLYVVAAGGEYKATDASNNKLRKFFVI